MLKPCLIVFLTYFILSCLDEFIFHFRRKIEPLEQWSHLLDSASLLICIAMVVCTEYSDKAQIPFGIFAIFSVAVLLLGELTHAKTCSGTEHLIHAARSMLHPIMLMTLFVTWQVIDGASFFMNMVLPFSTQHLRPLCYGYFAAIAGLLICQMIQCAVRAFGLSSQGKAPIANNDQHVQVSQLNKVSK